MSNTFICTNEAQKSKLLGFLLSNLQLNDKKLTFSVNYPYNELTQLNRKAPEGAKNAVWCNIVDAFQTAAILAQEDYKLKHLAEQFQLSATLV